MELRDGAYSKSGPTLAFVDVLRTNVPTRRPWFLASTGALLISDFYYPINCQAQHEVTQTRNRDHAHYRVGFYRVVQKDMALSKPPTIVGAEIRNCLDLLGSKDPCSRTHCENRDRRTREHDRESVLAETTRRIARRAQLSGSTAGTAHCVRTVVVCDGIEAYDDTRLIEAMLGFR